MRAVDAAAVERLQDGYPVGTEMFYELGKLLATAVEAETVAEDGLTVSCEMLRDAEGEEYSISEFKGNWVVSSEVEFGLYDYLTEAGDFNAQHEARAKFTSLTAARRALADALKQASDE